MLNKKHVLAIAAGGAMMLGASPLIAAPVPSGTAALKAANADGITEVRYKHRKPHHKSQARLMQNWRHAGPTGAPYAAAAGVGAATGAVVGGALATTGAVVGGATGYPYGYGYPYRYGYGAYASNPYGAYGNAYNSYAYAPGAYGAYGLSRDIGNGFYNYGAAPASQDNCAVDGGYGRLDYSQC
ncbi:MAG TPA: hypothetical protein VKE26_05140 [Xanthobacteraceae bacterium]|nr:hypothetical protein [Xanthobacteraceae bacterium]